MMPATQSRRSRVQTPNPDVLVVRVSAFAFFSNGRSEPPAGARLTVVEECLSMDVQTLGMHIHKDMLPGRILQAVPRPPPFSSSPLLVPLFEVLVRILHPFRAATLHGALSLAAASNSLSRVDTAAHKI
jgi:hypothetical protein